MHKAQDTPASSLIFSRRAFMRSFMFGWPRPLENCDVFPGALPLDALGPWLLCRCSGSALKVCKDSGAYAILERSRTLSLLSLPSTGALGCFAGLWWTALSPEWDGRFRFLDGSPSCPSATFTSSTGCPGSPLSTSICCWCGSDESAWSFLFCFAHCDRNLVLLTQACFALAA